MATSKIAITMDAKPLIIKMIALRRDRNHHG